MEEFKTYAMFRVGFGVGLIALFFGLITGWKEQEPIGIIIIAAFMTILLLFMNPKIMLEEDRIVERSLFQSRSTSFAEIASMSIRVNPLFMMNILRYQKYYLQLGKKDAKSIKIVRIYAYDGCERLLDLLEKKTGKKIDGRRPARSGF